MQELTWVGWVTVRLYTCTLYSKMSLCTIKESTVIAFVNFYMYFYNTCKATFSAMETIKSKHRCLLWDESLESLLICALSEIEPRFIQIIESSEFRISYKWTNLIFAINLSGIKIFVNELGNFLICFTCL